MSPAAARSRPDSADRDKVLTLIAIFKYVKAFLLIAVGLGALKFIGSDFRDTAQQLFENLGQSVDVVPVLKLLRQAGALGPNQLRLIGTGAFLYAALFLVEGTGLWLQRRWAEYLTVIATASFIPFEIFELTRKLSWPRVGTFVINVGVVAYLILRLRHENRKRRRQA